MEPQPFWMMHSACHFRPGAEEGCLRSEDRRAATPILVARATGLDGVLDRGSSRPIALFQERGKFLKLTATQTDRPGSTYFSRRRPVVQLGRSLAHVRADKTSRDHSSHALDFTRRHSNQSGNPQLALSHSDLAAEQQGVSDRRNFCETPDAPTPMLSIPRFDHSQNRR